MQSSRDKGRQVERGRQEIQAGTEAGGCRGRQADEQGGNKVKRYAQRNEEKQAG
jgi:hypothetical protein